MSYYYGDHSWEELQEYVKKDAILILPVGQTEEHGSHLPVSTDATIAEGFAKDIAEAVEGEVPVLVMPAIWAGYSPVSMGKWPGTMMVRPQVFIDYVYDVCASLVRAGFKKMVMLDCHGQHNPMLNIVTKLIADEFDGVYLTVTSPVKMSAEAFNKIRKSGRGGSCHGGEWETALMLSLTDLVNMDKVTDVDIIRYNSDFVAGDATLGSQKVVWSTWGTQQSVTGLYGDPTPATKETGDVIRKAAIENYKKFLKEYYEFGK